MGGAAASAAVDEEWELCNDDGFIYKRRKRVQPDEGLPLAAPSSGQQAAADPEAELRRNRLARRKLSLMALRDRYRREIEQWEGLVASLQEGGREGDGGGAAAGEAPTTCGYQEPADDVAASTTCGYQEPADHVAAPENPFHSLIGELMLQVEAQEAILKKLSDTCDIVDSACDMREETIMESLLNLPVWRSPRALMSSLSD